MYGAIDVNKEKTKLKKLKSRKEKQSLVYSKLVVLWGDYVKGTWSNVRWPKTMPIEAVKLYVEYIVNLFLPYNPVYIAGGDTDLRSGDAILYYKTIMETIKAVSLH